LLSAPFKNKGVMHNIHITLSKRKHAAVLSRKQIQLRKINKKKIHHWDLSFSHLC